MSGYTKLFNSILASTVWSEPNEVRIVWITMLAMADKRGVVEGSTPGLAVFARLSLDATETALDRLAAPDVHSRSKEHEGRRIEVTDGGWRIINHNKYREKMSADERREYLRVKQQEQRDKNKQRQHAINTRSVLSTESTHTAPAPTPAPDPSPDRTNQNKQVRPPELVPPAVPAASAAQSRKRPIYRNERFAVHQWQLDELLSMLGPQAETFDLHEWLLMGAVVKAKREPGIVPDWWKWLKAQTLSEAERRGLALATDARVVISAQGRANADAMARAAKRIQAREAP